MKKVYLLFKLIFIAIAMLCLTACSRGSMNRIKANNSMVQEYNEAIKIYNRVAIAFTDLARTVDKESKKTGEFADKFWDNYKSKEEKVIENMQRIKDYKFKHKEIQAAMERISPMLIDIETYLSSIEDSRNNRKDIGWASLNKENEVLYKEIVRQSNGIIETFDEIYNEYIVNKKD